MTDLGLIALLAVRLRSRGDGAAVAATVDDLTQAAASRVELAEALHRAVDRGQARRRGDVGRLSLTPAGEAELAALLATDLAADQWADIGVAYEAFLPVNRAFLAACVGWQDNPAELGDIEALVTAVIPIVVALTEVKSRFGSYRGRLEAALTEAETDPRWVDSPRFDSVHTVWFELHEHLLATLGRDRTDER